MIVQRAADGPLYESVYESIRKRILSGEYDPGDFLPSEPKLKEEFGVSIITVRRALHELEHDGLIERRQGLGSVVLDAAAKPVVIGLSTFTPDVAQGRLRVVRTLLEDSLVQSADDTAGRLGVQPGSLVRRMVRLDMEGEAPLSVDEVFIAPSKAAVITPEIAASPVFIDLWQDASGMTLTHSEYEILAEEASEEDAALLKMEKPGIILITRELFFDSSGTPAALVISRYRGDRVRISGTVTVSRQGG